MIFIAFYVPGKYKEKVKQAMFKAGAGKIGNYSGCCWETKGTGQFTPLDSAKPFIGKSGKTKKLKEYKIEMVCEDFLLPAVIEALKKAHPYEEPAYHAIKTEIIL